MRFINNHKYLLQITELEISAIQLQICAVCLVNVNDLPVKGKGKGLGTCYSATYMSHTCDQQHFTISEVAADWHEPVM